MSRSEASTCQIPKQRSRSWSTHQIQGLQFVRGHSHLSTNNGPQSATCSQDKALLTLLIQRILLITPKQTLPFRFTFPLPAGAAVTRRRQSYQTLPIHRLRLPRRIARFIDFNFQVLRISFQQRFNLTQKNWVKPILPEFVTWILNLSFIPNRIWNSEENCTEHWISVTEELLLRTVLNSTQKHRVKLVRAVFLVQILNRNLKFRRKPHRTQNFRIWTSFFR